MLYLFFFHVPVITFSGLVPGRLPPPNIQANQKRLSHQQASKAQAQPRSQHLQPPRKRLRQRRPSSRKYKARTQYLNLEMLFRFDYHRYHYHFYFCYYYDISLLMFDQVL